MMATMTGDGGVTLSHVTTGTATTNVAVDEDDNNVLPLSEQTQRPWDVALQQQRVHAWHPILDPVWAIACFYILAAICIPTGYKLQDLSDQVVELQQTYDSNTTKTNNSNPQCAIARPNENKSCTLNFTVPKYMTAPILVHYQLENFHQNQRKYSTSRDDYQLLGRVSGQDSKSANRCNPLNTLQNATTTITINPCGLIANTFFNDVFVLNNQDIIMYEEGIAWTSDLQYVFRQPDGFRYAPCPDCASCNCTDESDGPWSCVKPFKSPNGTCYKYFYPNDDTTQYLYETYPNIITPLEGVTNEHFVVWMRIATFPTFRKLYGYINQPLQPGTVLQFTVRANWNVNSFGGSKTLILSTNNKFGGKNQILGPMFYGVGYFCLIVAIFFSLKHAIRPRKIADIRYLHYKQE